MSEGSRRVALVATPIADADPQGLHPPQLAFAPAGHPSAQDGRGFSRDDEADEQCVLGKDEAEHRDVRHQGADVHEAIDEPRHGSNPRPASPG